MEGLVDFPWCSQEKEVPAPWPEFRSWGWYQQAWVNWSSAVNICFTCHSHDRVINKIQVELSVDDGAMNVSNLRCKLSSLSSKEK